MIPLFKPSLGKAEELAVVKTLRSGWLGSGPQVVEFEQKMAKLTGTKYAVALNSATAFNICRRQPSDITCRWQTSF